MADVERLTVPEPEESVPFILEAIDLVRARQAVIGFWGGPFTVAVIDRGQAKPRQFLEREAPMYSADGDSGHAACQVGRDRRRQAWAWR